MKTDQSLTATANHFQRIALIIGLVGMVLGIAGAITGNLDRFFQSYLFAFMFWLGLSLGSLAFMMIHFIMGSHWGLTVRRVNEAASSTLWVLGIMFIPLLFHLPGLYPWARPEAVQASAILQAKSPYLNVPFFIVRAVIYFAIWIGLSLILNRLSAQWANTGDPAIKGKMQGWSAVGLIIYTFSVTFASIDWVMSLEPFWNSTIYGLIVILGQMLSGLSFSIMILNLVPALGLGRQWTIRTTPTPFKDLGAWMLTFVLGWAYLSYFQLLIIWAGNMPRDIAWYVARTTGGWLTVGILVAIFQFVVPFAMLISMRVRNNLRLLGWLGAAVAFFYLVNLYWQIIPAFYPGQFSLSWLDIVLPVGLGGLWVTVFMAALKKRPALRELEEQSLQPATGHGHAISS